MKLYKAYCPKCKYIVYSQKVIKERLKFNCTCGCHWYMSKEFGHEV